MYRLLSTVLPYDKPEFSNRAHAGDEAGIRCAARSRQRRRSAGDFGHRGCQHVGQGTRVGNERISIRFPLGMPVAPDACEMFFQPAAQAVGTMFSIEADIEFCRGPRRDDIGRRIAHIL